ncbi:hypothetical protein [Streptomyces macrosporus]|uniref:hypothetical protein n=1 Tax=Streptomyces macrosporus TaxID=44032 RepID=UPI0031CF3D24
MTNALASSPRPSRPVRPAPPARDFSWLGARLVALDPARTAGRSGRSGREGSGSAGGERVRSYRAEAVAVGTVHGGRVAVQLGSHEAPSRRLALRWLREQARRIADGLDPDPRASTWVPAGALVPLPELSADVPTELRRWCGDEERQRAASDLLAEGLPFHLAVADHTGSYALSVRPVGAADAYPDPVPSAATPARVR